LDVVQHFLIGSKLEINEILWKPKISIEKNIIKRKGQSFTSFYSNLVLYDLTLSALTPWGTQFPSPESLGYV